jgi:RHS repeat-associated protein
VGTISYSTINQPSEMLNLHPGAAGERSVVRWTAQRAGTYQIAGRFQGLDINGTTTDVAVVHNGATNLFTGNVTGYGAQQAFAVTVTVQAGQTIDFRVGWGGNGNYGADSTGLTATVTETSEADVNWLVADHLGTPRMIADKTGSLANVKRHDYLPFGEEVGAGVGGRTEAQGYRSDNLRHRYTTYERDFETGLDYAQARYYGSTQGRFTSPDPYIIMFEMEKGRDEKERRQFFLAYISQPQIWNKYTYALNNPLKYTHPDGLRPLTKEDERRLDRLGDEYVKAYRAGDAELMNAIGGAIIEILDAIHAVPDGAQDPDNLQAVFFAIDNLGNSDYGKDGTVGNGYTVTIGPGDWKCNIFCANAYAQGAGVGFGGRGVPTNSTFLGGLFGRKYPPVANDFANPSTSIQNFAVVGSPTLGDIAAYPNPGGLGHSAIYVGGNAVIYASRDDVKNEYC